MSAQSENCTTWTDLPFEVLRNIEKRINITDRIQLSAVCRSWSSASTVPSFPSFHPKCPVPWLLLSSRQNSQDDDNCTEFKFYDIATGNSNSVLIPIHPLSGHRWLGSSKGWLIFVSPQRKRLHVFRLLKGGYFILPSLPEYCRRIILCRSPDQAMGYLVTAISKQGDLFISWFQNRGWNKIRRNNYPYLDVVFHRGKVCSLVTDGLWCLVVGSYIQSRQKYLFRNADINFSLRPKYLVEWRGDLVMIMVQGGPWKWKDSSHDESSAQVELYKLHFGDGDSTCYLSRVVSLGDDTMFVGTNNSSAVSTTGNNNIRGNCVYFTKDVWRPFGNVEETSSSYIYGIFDLENSTCTTYRYDSISSYGQAPISIWFWPC